MLLPFATPEPQDLATSDPTLPTTDDVEDWVREVSENTVGFLVVVGVAIVLWFIGGAIIRAIVRGIERGAPLTEERTRRFLRRAKIKVAEAEPETIEERLAADRRHQRAATLGVVMKSALAVVLVAMVAVTGLATLGVPVGPMLASAGILGVALGFGAQSLVKDILSGIFMLMEDQYGVGDVIDVGPAIGTVEEIGLRSTRLRSLDGTVWYVPNGEITRVGNMTRLWSRVMIEVRFRYDTDIEAARAAMIDAVNSAKSNDEEIAAAVIDEPEVAGIESLEYNAVMLRLLCQVNPSTQWNVQREVRREMRRIFAERDIFLAVPGDAMVVDSSASPRKIELHDSERPADDRQPQDEHGQPLPPAPDGD